MRLNKNGQSALEYTLLATIILLGIVVGGPFVHRSVQGYLKGIDDSITDSSQEEIMQAGLPPASAIQDCHCTPSTGKTLVNPVDGKTYPDETVPANNTEAYYNMVSTWTKGDCGVGPCPATQRYYYRGCSPMKCNQEDACLPDLACCTPATLVQCGSEFPDSGTTSECPNSTASKYRNDLPSGFSATDYKGTCIYNSKKIGGGYDSIVGEEPKCPIGEQLYKITCPDPKTGVFTSFNKNYDPTAIVNYYACKPIAQGDLNCLPSCYQDPFPKSTPCNANPDGTSLEKDALLSGTDRIAQIDESRARFYSHTDTEITNISNDYAAQSTTTSGPANTTCIDGDLPCMIALLHSGTPTSGNSTFTVTPPARLLSQYGENTDPAKKGAWRNHYVYMERRAQCSNDTTNNGLRLCERKCPGGYVPNVYGELNLQSNETCIHLACWYGVFEEENNLEICPNTSKDMGASGRICSSKRADPRICGDGVENDICDYLLICLGGDESTTNRFMSRGDNVAVSQLAASTASCEPYSHKVLNKNWKTGLTTGYCYKYTPPQSPQGPLNSEISPFSCNNGVLYMTVFGCNAPDNSPGSDILISPGT